MLHPYIAVALLSATYEVDSDDFTYGTVPSLPTVNASGTTFSACRQKLRTMIEQHIISRLETGDTLPVLHGVMPPTSEAELRRHNTCQTSRVKQVVRQSR